MGEWPEDGFDVDTAITARLGEGADSEAHLQALAILIDADLTEEQRTDAFAAVMGSLLTQLSLTQRERFQQIAEEKGEVAAMFYLSEVTRQATGSQRR